MMARGPERLPIPLIRLIRGKGGRDQANSGSRVFAVELVEERLRIRGRQMDATHDAIPLHNKTSL
jgi:hypothetical protein